MKTKLLCAKTAMFALACFSSIGVWGQIKITDENGLKAIAENLNGDYVLENNITLSKEETGMTPVFLFIKYHMLYNLYILW